MTLIWLASGWLLGVAAGAITGEVWWPAVAGLGAAALANAILSRRPGLAVIGLLAVGLFVAGGLRYVDQRPPDEPTGIALHNEADDVRFRALVNDEPAVRGRTQRVQLSVREVLEDGVWVPTTGGVLLRAGRFPRYQYGDLLELSGELETPPSFPDFDYRDYLARQGITSLIAFPDEARTIDTGEGNRWLATVHGVRRQLGDALARTLPEPQAALAQGIFLGQRSAIPADLAEAMNATGTSHLVAISGYNVSLVAALIITSLAWLIGRRRAAVAALIAIAAYTVLTGASPTVVRAAIMGGLVVTATLAGRPGSAGTSIAFAAALMTGWNPLVIEDVSFQLSFAAILGIVYLSPVFQERAVSMLRARGIDAGEGTLASFLVESTSLTAAAVFATMPLFALYFDRVSVVTFAANLVLVPAFPLILASSALTAVAATVWEPLGHTTGWISWAALTYMIEVARFFADVPLAAVDIDGFGRWHAAVAYTALGALAWWLARNRVDPDTRSPSIKEAPTLRLRPAHAVMAVLAISAGVVWWAALDQPDGRLVVTVLDVGQGDAILVETPAGHHLLIDGGADGQRLMEELGKRLPFWERSLDLVVLTHPQEDHLAGLVETLRRYEVAHVLATARDSESPTYEAWRTQIRRQGIRLTTARPGQRIELGDGAVLRVLAPGGPALAASNANNSSLVVRLEYGDASFLLTGDVESTGEEALLSSDASLSATVLKVPHHGSRTSTTPAFLRAVQPTVAIVSVGDGNPYGHPSPTVLERLDGTLLLRTDQHGAVRLSTDGRTLWVQTER